MHLAPKRMAAAATVDQRRTQSANRWLHDFLLDPYPISVARRVPGMPRFHMSIIEAY